jgi:hypothetical protein
MMPGLRTSVIHCLRPAWTPSEPLVEPQVPVIEFRYLAIYDQVQELRRDLQRVPVCHDQVADLAGLDRTQTVADTENLGIVDRNRPESLFLR